MPLSITLVEAPTEEPIGIEDIRAHCRISFHDEDVLLLMYAQAARDYVEKALRRTLLTTTWRLSLDMFPCGGWGGSRWGHVGPAGSILELPRPPLQSITEITYLDSAGEPQTLDTAVYGLSTASEPGRLWLQPGQAWPVTQTVWDAVQITYKAGWEHPGQIPMSIRAMVLLLTAHLYENREATVEKSLSEVPLAITTFLWANRILEVA